MCLFLDITNEGYTHAGYLRKYFKGHNLFKQFAWNEITIDTTSATRLIQDKWAEVLYQNQRIERELYDTYIQKIDNHIQEFEEYDGKSNQDIYDDIATIRASILGELLLEDVQHLLVPISGDGELFINQYSKEKELAETRDGIIFYLSDYRFINMFMKDIEKYKNHTIYIVGKKKNYYNKEVLKRIEGYNIEFLWEETDSYCIDFSKIRYNSQVQELVNLEKIFLIGYGEEAMYACKDLSICSIVNTTSETITSKAMTNNFIDNRISKIYVKKNCNIYPYVTIKEKTILSYYHLAKLAEQFGYEIYDESVSNLYTKYPEWFVNIYDTSGQHSSISLEEQSGITYKTGYFDCDTWEEKELNWSEKENQNAILVNAAILHNVKSSEVINLSQGEGVRKYFQHSQEDSVSVISNFLYFSTRKTIELHNKLRVGSPLEQVKVVEEHIDYSRRNVEGQRIETFPLYKKSCIGMKEDGQFGIFRFLLNDGVITCNGIELPWTKNQINVSQVEADEEQDVLVYTPYSSKEDISEDIIPNGCSKYTKLVGDGRLNIGIIGANIYCIKKGVLMLPSNGVIVSISGNLRKQIENTLTLSKVDAKYYEVSDVSYACKLNPPEGISSQEWESYQWIYGGAMTLIAEGRPLFDQNTIKEHMIEEGWETPLSIQTQESDVQNLSVHPRTAFGMNKKGELFVLVYSGRTAISRGADYLEMIHIGNKMIEDIECMVNGDGGASAVLALVKGKEVMELSYPAASDQTCAGAIRDIKTIFQMKL